MDTSLEVLVEKFKEFQASREFDKETLIEAHEESMRQMASEHWLPSVPLEGLRPIRARDLQIHNHHQARVLFGTLCADAHCRILAIMTILEDQYGDAVRLAIYNNSLSTMETEGARRLYPKGSKVAIKQPYFMQGAQDGALMLRVDNPQNVEILASFPGNAETSLAKDLLELRSKGNKCFQDEDWNKAIEYYSRCIDLALARDKIEPQILNTSNIEEKVKEALVYSYSNRAEARLKLKEYQDAVQDSEKALALDHHHLKSLFRKGRAFHSLGEYKLACQCFDRALEQSPTAKDIQLQYEKSMELSCQNQQGKFDLSAYFINGCKAAELSNYIGPVLIKKSVVHGRGLFATDNVDVGDFLLVDNAIALSCTETTRSIGSLEKVMFTMIELKTKLGYLKRDLEAKIISSAASSPRILQQLEYLADSEEMKVPPLDLFRINNASWNNYDCNQGWKLDHHKLTKIMQNVASHKQPIDSNIDMVRHNEKFGLWALPSFINHSCFPNASCIVVGEAMFIIAARKIAAGEEITIAYFDCFQPLFRRELLCGGSGFKCDCKRCMLERSLVAAEASPLQEVAELVYPMDSNMLTDFELWQNAMQVENTINVLTTEEKKMIRASFFQLYFSIFGLQRIHPYAMTILPSMSELFDGLQEVVPGHCLCLDFFAMFAAYANDQAETDRVLKKGLEICTAYMGKHEESVLKSVLKSVATGVLKPGYTVFSPKLWA